MKKIENAAIAKAGKWEKPTLKSVQLDVSDVAFGFNVGTDGDSPGPPDTSMS